MNAEDIVREVTRKFPTPAKPRAEKGAWVKPAWAVRVLVEKEGYGVTEAIRNVIAVNNFFPPDRAFGGIRAHYYSIRKLP